MAFEASGSNDGVILFSSCDGCDGFEIVIGGWSNQYSVIREYKQEKVGGCGDCDVVDIRIEVTKIKERAL